MLRWNLPSSPAFTFAIAMLVRLAEPNAYTTPEAGLLVPGDGPPTRRNVPDTVPDPAFDAPLRDLDDAHPELQTSSRTSPAESHTACLYPRFIATRTI